MQAVGLASLMMIASGSIHAVVNAIVKGRRTAVTGENADTTHLMAARALTDGSSALMLLPALPFVAMPHGAWVWLASSALLHPSTSSP